MRSKLSASCRRERDVVCVFSTKLHTITQCTHTHRDDRPSVRAWLSWPCLAAGRQQQPVNLRHSPCARTQRIFSDSDNVVVVVVRHYHHHQQENKARPQRPRRRREIQHKRKSTITATTPTTATTTKYERVESRLKLWLLYRGKLFCSRFLTTGSLDGWMV